MPLPNLTLTNFTGEVSPTIVDRGQDYFYRGLVTSLEESQDGQWVAQVRGTTMYTVEISLSKDVVTAWSCTCPYDYGPVCKHVVAALYALQERDSGAQASEEKDKQRQSPGERFHSLVDGVSPDKLREFLHEYAGYHPEIRQEFLAKFSAADSPDSWRDYVAVIRESAKAGADRHGFINYSASFRVMKPIHTMIQQAYEKLESAEYHGAWQIARAIAQEVPKIVQRMDDSSGDGGLVTDNALDILREIGVSTKDDDLHSEIFRFVLENYPKKQYTDFGFDDTLLSVAVDLIRNPEQASQVEQVIDNRLEELEKEQDDFSYRYNLQQALEHKIDFLKQVGRDDEAGRIIDDHLEIAAFREQRLRDAIDAEEFESAKSLVQEAIERVDSSQKPPGYRRRWERWLYRIADAEGDTEDIRRYARQFFLGRGHDFTYYEALKATYSEEDWTEVLEELLQKLQEQQFTPVRTLAEAYVREDRWDDLVDLLKENPGLSHLKSYREYLADDYPDALLDMYGVALRDYARKNTGRKYYREIVGILNSLHSVAGGTKFVRNIVEEFRETYQRRPAMQEELEKVRVN